MTSSSISFSLEEKESGVEVLMIQPKRVWGKHDKRIEVE